MRPSFKLNEGERALRIGAAKNRPEFSTTRRIWGFDSCR